MPRTSPQVDAYIEAAPAFARPILERVRRAFHRGCPDAEEAMKWSAPHFVRRRLLGGMAAHKRHVSIGFWRGAEMNDPEGLLHTVGRTEMCFMKVRSVEELPSERVLVAYVEEAVRLDGEGQTARRKPKHAPKRVVTPRDLAAALKQRRHAKAKAFWSRLAPGYRKEYVEWLADAKRDATRARRLATTLEWLGEGKTRNWRYRR